MCSIISYVTIKTYKQMYTKISEEQREKLNQLGIDKEFNSVYECIEYLTENYPIRICAVPGTHYGETHNDIDFIHENEAGYFPTIWYECSLQTGPNGVRLEERSFRTLKQANFEALNDALIVLGREDEVKGGRFSSIKNLIDITDEEYDKIKFH